MVNPVRAYAWGSRTLLSGLRGDPPTPGPEAEVWMGGHADDPSDVVLPGGRRLSLAEYIGGSPQQALGERLLARPHAGRPPGPAPRLPYLMKLLAAGSPLSVQLHPAPDQAATGYAAEQAAGVAADDPRRTYKDPYGKPELLVALRPFATLAGLRPPAQARALVSEVGPDVADRLWPGGTAAAAGGHPVDAVGRLLEWPAARRGDLLERAAAAAGRLGDPAQSGVAATADPWTWVTRLVAGHPDDPAALLPLLLALVVLAPGQGLFLPAGALHAYLSGLGIEVMGASDNVLRAGLTSKYVDVPAVLDTARAAQCEPVLLAAHPDGAGGQVWDAPVADFRLHRLELAAAPVRLPGDAGPQVLLCTTGRVTVGTGPDTLALQPTESAFVPAAAGPVTVHGPGTLFRCVPGPDRPGNAS